MEFAVWRYVILLLAQALFWIGLQTGNVQLLEMASALARMAG